LPDTAEPVGATEPLEPVALGEVEVKVRDPPDAPEGGFTACPRATEAAVSSPTDAIFSPFRMPSLSARRPSLANPAAATAPTPRRYTHTMQGKLAQSRMTTAKDQ
jgi:hypothetical protein